MNRIKNAWHVLTGRKQAIETSDRNPQDFMTADIVEQSRKLTESEAAINLSDLGRNIRDNDEIVIVTCEDEPLFAMVSVSMLRMYDKLDGLAAEEIYRQSIDEERIPMDEVFRDFPEGDDSK
ncbi:hypothetical protein ABT282_08740 [Streptomyces sp. NPDC000927]|uniref:hypothetical protein n=1 Tax=Streptomyces sp. NPDC000927 TaxID=3154371 RepID=UPI00332176AF